MYPANFDYFRAASVEEAVALLHRHKESKVLAGGHSLIPILKLRLAEPKALIDIRHIHILRGISHQDGAIRIGSLTTHAEIASSDVLATECPLLAEAASHIGDPQVRNRGTIGGNVAHADPASDLPAALVALHASVEISGPSGKRSVAAGDFFKDLLETDLDEHEIVTAIVVPEAAGTNGMAYLKFEHPASGYAICGAAAVIFLDRGAVCREARLALNGVAATPGHVSGGAVAAALKNSTLSDEEIDRAVDENLSVDDPLGDVHASAEYRAELAKVFSKRALKLARDRAKS